MRDNKRSHKLLLRVTRARQLSSPKISEVCPYKLPLHSGKRLAMFMRTTDIERMRRKNRKA